MHLCVCLYVCVCVCVCVCVYIIWGTGEQGSVSSNLFLLLLFFTAGLQFVDGRKLGYYWGAGQWAVSVQVPGRHLRRLAGACLQKQKRPNIGAKET